jgi:hypothetical protein
MRIYGGVEIQIHVLLTSAVVGSSVVNFMTILLPRTGLDDVESPYRDSNSDPSAVQPIVSRYTGSPNG